MSERSAAAAEEATQPAIGKVQQQHDAGIEDTKAGEVAGGEEPPCRWVQQQQGLQQAQEATDVALEEEGNVWGTTERDLRQAREHRHRKTDT